MVAFSVRVGSGATFVGIGNLVSTLSLFAVSVAVGRLAGAANLGRYGLLVALGSFFGGIVDFGADRVLTERLAQRSPHWIAAWWGVLLVKGCALGLGLVVGLVALEADHAAFALLIAIQGAAVTANLTAQAMAAALNRLPALATVRVVTRLAALAGIGATVALTADVGSLVTYSIVVVSIADLGGVGLLGAIVIRPELRNLERVTLSQAGVLGALRTGLPLGVSSLAVWLYLKLDTVILAGVTDLSTLGVYTAAVRLAELLGGIPTALNSVALTALADLWSKNTRRFRLARDSILVTTTLGMGLICTVVFILSTPIVDATYRLPNASLYLGALVWGQVYAASGVICGVSLQVSKQSPAVAYIAVTVAILGIPTYIVSIAFLGAFGAAVATTALYAAILPIGLLLPASRETFLPLLASTAVLILCLVTALAVVKVAQLIGPIPLLAQVALASVAYSAVAACGLFALSARRVRRERLGGLV